jgi:hypothetical protein
MMLTDRLIRRFVALPPMEIDDLAPPLESGERERFILDHVNMPPRPDCGLLHDDLGTLIRILRAVRPRCILELGTGRGNATANLCLFSEAQVFTVNALEEQISGKTVTFILPRNEIGQVYRDHGYENRVTQIYCDTLDFRPLDYLEAGSVDLAVIDACHDTDYVLSDFHTILPTLSADALVLLHDTHPSRNEHLRYSYDACARLRFQGFDVHHIRDTWWGIWRNGDFLRHHPAVVRRRWGFGRERAP